jgi:stalled ribosome rescue protein Dom34
VENLKRKRGYKRGYSVALLVGLEDNRAVLWQIFSNVAKPYATTNLDGKRTDYRALYNFHESIVNALRPTLNEGARSIVVTSPMKTTYATDFLDHVRKHHAHLIQSKNPDGATFATLVGSADQPYRVAELVKTKEFLQLIAETTSHEADHIVYALDKNIYNINGNSAALFSLKEIEDKVYDLKEGDNFRTDYLVLTEKYLADAEDKSRVHRLLQIARNMKIETKIVKAETPAGKRISQFGGIVLFTKATRQRAPKR